MFSFILSSRQTTVQNMVISTVLAIVNCFLIIFIISLLVSDVELKLSCLLHVIFFTQMSKTSKCAVRCRNFSKFLSSIDLRKLQFKSTHVLTLYVIIFCLSWFLLLLFQQLLRSSKLQSLVLRWIRSEEHVSLFFLFLIKLRKSKVL